MAYIIGMMVGGLIPTFLVSRLLLWLLRSWEGGAGRYYFVHAISFAIASLIAGMGMANGGPFVPLQAASVYWAPQLVWLIVDLLRLNAKGQESSVQATKADDGTYLG